MYVALLFDCLGFCLKTKTSDDHKVFINICHSNEVHTYIHSYCKCTALNKHIHWMVCIHLYIYGVKAYIYYVNHLPATCFFTGYYNT